MVLNKRKGAICLVLALFCIFQIISLTDFSNAEGAVISFSFDVGDVIIYDSHAYKLLKNIEDTPGVDRQNALSKYILELGEDSENFNKTFIRLNRTEECMVLRERYMNNNEVTYKSGDNPWISKDFWQALIYVDPCFLDVTQDGLSKTWNFTKNQTGIKTGWMFGTNTFSGESKIFPIYLVFPFKVGSTYLFSESLEVISAEPFFIKVIFLLVFIFIFVVFHYFIGLLARIFGFKYGFWKTLFIGFLVSVLLPGFVYVWLATKNGLFAFLCLIFFTIMLNMRFRYLFNSSLHIGKFQSHNFSDVNMMGHCFTFNPIKTYFCLYFNNLYRYHSFKSILGVSIGERKSYVVLFFLFLLYPFLGSIPVINVILSFLTLEVLFAPLFWRALLCTFVLFMLVQFWPMTSRYNKKRRLYKKAMEKVAGEEVLKEMGRA